MRRARAGWTGIGLLLVACAEQGRRGFEPGDGSADVPLAPSGVGRACPGDGELPETTVGCGAGQQCFTAVRGFPGGYCVQSCLHEACPPDGFCVTTGSDSYCLRRCASADDCREGEGYVCQHLSPTQPAVCIPDPAPVGHAPKGQSCADAVLAAGTFPTAAVSVSHDREDSDMEVDPSLAVGPDGTVLLAYVARDPLGDRFGGLSVFRDGHWNALPPLLDQDYSNAEDPSLVVDRAGVFYLSWRGRVIDRATVALRVARSESGSTWSAAVRIAPPGRCTGGCDPPVLALGPRTDDLTSQSLHATYIARSTRGAAWVVTQHSEDGARGFSAPVEIGRTDTPVDAAGQATPFVRDPIGVDAATDARGGLHVAWAMLSRANPRGGLGDPHNQIRYARGDSDHFSPDVVVSRADESVVTLPPRVAVVGSTVGVLYVSGGADGRWDLVLATSDDGLAWQYRRVNDDHAQCATHGWAALAADPARGVFHALWLDNRTGDGGVRYTRCPAAGAVACAPNELVPSETFHLSTTDNPNRWHGRHAALALDASGHLWAAWSGVLTGGPAIYAALGSP